MAGDIPKMTRLMKLVAMLRKNSYPNHRTLQRALKMLDTTCMYSISQKTIQRDVQYLRDVYHAPIAFDNGKRGYYLTDQYKAIVDMKGNKCPYTGKVLRWDLIGKWGNDAAKKGEEAYKKEFEYLPTVDHKNAEPVPDFVICSWVANDAKNDLTEKDFVELCEDVYNYKKSLSGPSGL